MPANDHTTSEDNSDREAKHRARARASYYANQEAIKARYHANKESICGQQRLEYETNEAKRQDWRDKSRRYREANKDKVLARKKSYRKANKERETAQAKIRKIRGYGLDEAEYAAMLASCKGRCPCCKTPFSEILGKSTRPCIDHCHKKGRKREAVRGLICGRCNLVLGHAADDPKTLRACARYLEGKKA